MSPTLDVVGLGVASWDLIGVAAQAPELGLKQPLGGWAEMGGGPVATALVTLARLGARVAMAGAVGDDGYGARIRADLAAAGVDVSALAAHPGGSHVAFVLAEPGQDRRTVWWHNDPAVLAAAAAPAALLATARALLIDSHMPAAALAAAQAMRAAGGRVMIDAERARPATLDLLPHCTEIVVSARFGREATGHADPALAAAALAERHGALAVVTAGAAGSWAAHGAERIHTPAFAAAPVDTTGCGDVFHGALLFALLRGDALRPALRLASAAAALKTRGLGGRGAIPTLAEVEALLAEAV